jgi:hypothetical protein
VLLPLVLISFATIAAAVMAYGTHPHWAQFEHGLDLILLSRRLQWPFVTISLVLCLVLIGLVISGRRRAWWLLGLAPVLALFAHRFATDPVNALAVVDEPTMVAPDAAAAAGVVADDDYVVGLVFQDVAYAYPYSSLYRNPVVVQSDHDKRMLLMWSAFANRAVAVSIGRDVRGRDLDVVSLPANALLVYNRRLGEFVSGVTGEKVRGGAPSGFKSRIPTARTTWRQWRERYPGTRVAILPGGRAVGSPTGPILPTMPMPPAPAADGAAGGGMPAEDAMVTFVETPPRALALPPGEVGLEPMNLSAGGVPVLLFRDGATGEVRAFDRRIEADLSPQFRAARDNARREKGATFVDADTNTAWTAHGVAVDGERKGHKLRPVPVEEALYWGVMKFWYPGLELVRQPMK